MAVGEPAVNLPGWSQYFLWNSIFQAQKFQEVRTDVLNYIIGVVPILNNSGK